ncbi:AraC family transcriptional regulator [Fusibacter sp. 3D3]|uniref:helix-turn-helix transcriptional regulator n=1 Tax=Fusibacter sp. 3D3 TaxID=1048380 RepID=UPI0008539987|nr:AraC family transcriptional regulator [Fusibacter sp. 3D3]GAU76300.1 DNA-binding response regulator, AraC family [Fusibacter sp. 3D3]
MNYIRTERTTEIYQMNATHFHDSIELYYQVTGEKEYFIKDRTYHIIPGDLIFIAENTLHKTFVGSKGPMDRILVEIHRQALLKNYANLNLRPLFHIFDQKSSVFRLPLKIQHEVYRLLSALDACESMDTPLYPVNTLKVARLIELLHYLNITFKQMPRLTENHCNLHTNKIFKYVNHHYAETLTLERLSAQFGLNKYYLCKIFKESSGFTLTEYQNTIRIKKAVELLQHTPLNITEISEKIGYNDSSYFGKVFKRYMKVSPLKFRKHL